MSGCGNDNCSSDRLHECLRGTLQIVLGFNAVMFDSGNSSLALCAE